MDRREFLEIAGLTLSSLVGIKYPPINPCSQEQTTIDELKSKKESNITKRKTYLKILNLHKGLFSGEKAVRLRDYTGKESSGFFGNEHIKDGMLEVSVVSEEENIALVKLPAPTLEHPGNKSYLYVKKEDLKSSY